MKTFRKYRCSDCPTNGGNVKKFFLSIDQRDTIINSLLSRRDKLKGDLENKQPVKPLIQDVVDAQLQQIDMMVALFAVSDSERL